MSVAFSGDLNGRATTLSHFWEHTVGSGHATLGLRADWQSQLRRVRQELGMRHVRFHGILCDDMGTLIEQGGELIYSFFNADQIIDYLLSIDMKPFVELSFMPSCLASGGETVFHYRANVSAPRDHAQWSVLIRRLVQHWVDRYGIGEVRQWFFEVWNEPNLTAFGSGKLEEYLELYRYTVEAIKSIDGSLKIGGPATAANAWIDEFLGFCNESKLPLDFISTHHYPTDAFGKPGDDTVTQLADGTRSVLREEARTVRRQAGKLPVYYTEWCTSSNPRDAMHDDPYAAAFIVKTVLEANGLVQGYSYWTFTDIFEENYFPSVPFQGGFGLLTIHGIAKPAYRAFELLHQLGHELLPVTGHHDTVDAWLIRGDHKANWLLTNFALPRHPIQEEMVSLSLDCPERVTNVTVQRIDLENGNAKRHWEQIGKPDYLSASMVKDLNAASCLAKVELPFTVKDGKLTCELVVPPQAVASIALEF